MKNLTITIYLENQISLLNWIFVLLWGKSIKVEAIDFSGSEVYDIYRLTIVVYEEEKTVKEICLLIGDHKNVFKVYYNTDDEIVWQELGLYKVPTDIIAEKMKVERLLREHGAKAVVIRRDYTVFELSGQTEEIDSLLKTLEPYGLTEFVRSARIAIRKEDHNLHTEIKEHGYLMQRQSDENSQKEVKVSFVYIYIPQKVELFQSQEITEVCAEFMEALGFNLEAKADPVFKSFWTKLKFVFKKHITAEELDAIFTKGKKALELKHIDMPTAEQTEKLALASERLVRSLDKFDEGVARCGAIIVLKIKKNGKSNIIIQQLNHDLIKFFDEKPQLLYSIQTTYELITGDVKK